MTVGSDEGLMRAIALPIVILMLTATFAGCVGGDPDGDNSSGIDMEILNQMIDDNLQDFINNTSVTVNNYHSSNETHHTYNTYNGSSNQVHLIIAAGTSEGVSTTEGESSNHTDMVLLVRSDSYSNPFPFWTTNSWNILDGAKICVGIGSETEGMLVNAFSSSNIAFTSVPIADSAEALAKFIDGSCDAITGSRNMIELTEAQLENDGSMGVALWITDAYASGAAFFAIDSRFEYTITQDYGMMISFGGAHFEITLTGTCVQNCTSEDENTSQVFIFDKSPINQSSPGSSNYNMISDCDIEGYGELNYYNFEGLTILPGLDCTTTLSVHAHLWGDNPNYEYTWSDWAYYITWSESEVTMEE